MNDHRGRWALKAHTIFPVDGPPIDSGLLTISGDRIETVGENTSGAKAIDLGEVAILPGLVNAHTHLEFSDLPAPLGRQGMAMPDWIRLVIGHRRSRTMTNDRSDACIESGLAASVAGGVTTLGEIATTDWPLRRVGPMPIDLTAFRELIGLAVERSEELQELGDAFVRSASGKSSDWQPGMSPHAPYSVHPTTVQAAVRLSRKHKVPLAMHLAETTEELQLLYDGNGPFREMLVELGSWHPGAIAPKTRPLDYLKMLTHAERALVIHGNYLDDEALGWMARRADRMALVYCPRTHAFFGHDRYPLVKAIAAGVRMAIGTDSRASNPDLSLFNEMRFVRNQYTDLSGEALLKLGTINGAEALGRDEIVGSLTAGKAANLAIVELAPQARSQDIYGRMFDTRSKVIATVFQGQVIGDDQGRIVQ